MQKINALFKNPDYITYLQKNRDCEINRIYCRHDLNHALDVARIAYILNLEEQLGFDKETVYAMALVHDIGRWKEYETGIPHEEAGQVLAEDLLKNCGFKGSALDGILQAIGEHRVAGKPSLSSLLYRADKLSRNCTGCAAIKTCKRFTNNEVPFLAY